MASCPEKTRLSCHSFFNSAPLQHSTDGVRDVERCCSGKLHECRIPVMHRKVQWEGLQQTDCRWLSPPDRLHVLLQTRSFLLMRSWV